MSSKHTRPIFSSRKIAGNRSRIHNNLPKLSWALLGLALLIGSSAGPLRGQAVWSTILGYVSDPSGGAIPGAEVTVTNKLTSVATKATTDSTGSFNITHLDPGEYTLSVTASGFKAYTQTGIQLAVTASVRVEVKLELGAVTQEITVAAQTAQLETQSTQVTQSFTSNDIENLPIFGRNVSYIQFITPGAERDTTVMGPGENPTQTARVWVNGTWSGQQTYMLDGINDIDAGFSGLQVIVPLQDSVQEFKVTTADYDAEFGQTSGMVAQYVTKSGTNRLHGTLNWFNRNKDTFAADPITEKIAGTGPSGKGIGVPPFNFNQGGGSIGGPIKKDKFFFFEDFQFQRQVYGNGEIVTNPEAAFRIGDFSSQVNQPGGLTNLSPQNEHPIYDPATGNPDGTGRTQFSCPSDPGVYGPLNVICPSRLAADTVPAKLLGLLPPTSSNTPGSGTDSNYAGLIPSRFNTQQSDSRIDYNISDKDKIFVRYSLFWDTFNNSSIFGKAAGGTAVAAAENGKTKEQQSALNWTHTFTPSLLAEFRAGFNRFSLNAYQLDSDLETDNQVGIPNINTGQPITGGLAGITVAGPVGGFNMGVTSGTGIPRFEGTTTLEGVNNWTWMHGKHEFRFGVDIVRQEFNFLSVNASTRGNFNFAQTITGDADSTLYGDTGLPVSSISGIGMATFLLGLPSEFDRAILTSFPGERQTRAGAFISDIWRLNRKLTLTLGLRWDKFTAVTAHFPGGLADYDPTTNQILLAGLGSVSKSANVYSPDTDFAPRVGFAYQVTSKNVIRAGYGRSYFESGYDATFYHLTSFYPIVAQQTFTQPSTYFPIGFTLNQGPPSGTPPALPSTGMLTPPQGTLIKSRPFDWKTETMDSWNLTVERQLTPTTLLDVAYVGGKGSHLGWQYNYNSAEPGPGSFISRRPLDVAFGNDDTDNYMCNCSDSNFNSLQIQVRKAYSKSLTFQTNVVWEKNMSYDGSTTPEFRRFDYGPGAGSNAYSGSWSHGTQDRALTWNFAHTYILPYGQGQHWGSDAHGIAKLALAGWQFSGVTTVASGLGFTPEWSNGAELNADFGQRADTVPGCNWRSVPGGQTVNHWWNQSCFRDPAIRGGLYTFGDAGVGSLRGPGSANVDLSLWKEFAFSSPLNREKTAIQIRVDAYNALNLTNPDNPSGWDADVPSNAKITALAPQYIMRELEFGIHVEF